ncbi:hypothetical protein SERLADRAFT_415965 [Serpula lacrymans var. lacrymans S7.9]|uniref:Fatty acid desaturase domain-containing protein n=1 Tax=Serpula lacrymans var. lacrymans (strain S7.9) TaxID=578457 RepID=F8P0A5_SERL9|nr:uncharacterized protein SERLADRAFT_415965 [Serpula lacrymans var. lacrymans S7.9]EGO23478.1 hypothetical protein SERLADRAFT_415965 [Serpula lacrymans var. lacrymans S7.9]
MGTTKALWTREQVAAQIVAGKTLVIYNKLLLSIPQAWLDAHPGGSLAILHFMRITRTSRYVVGTVETTEHGWEPFVPPTMVGWTRKVGGDGQLEWFREANVAHNTVPSEVLLIETETGHNALAQTRGPTMSDLILAPTELSLQVQSQHSAAYKRLHKRIIDAGLYQTCYVTGYGPEVARYALLAVISAIAYTHNWLITSAICLGLLWQQLVFTVHDLGHMGVTHNWTVDRLIAIVLADFIGGLSVGWWVDNHNVHHLVTNHPSHDPDIEHLPFLAISTAFFNSLWSSYYKRIMTFNRFTAFVVSLQHKLFYVILGFGRFNLYVLAYGFLFRRAFGHKRAKGGRWSWWLEIIGCGSWSKALIYLLVSHFVTAPLHVQFVLSHFSMSTEDLGPMESFPHRQLRTTTDVICPPALSFLHGGLHLQVTHHLFPRLPRHNLLQASGFVKEFAKEQGLTYAEFGFVSGNKQVLDVLKGVADQAQIMSMVAESEIRGAMEKKEQ